MTLTKAEIAEHIQNELGLPRRKATESVETVVELMKQSLESEDDVLISGFENFNVKEKKPRKWRHPVSGDYMMLDARKVVEFACSKKLRDRMNGGGCVKCSK